MPRISVPDTAKGEDLREAPALSIIQRLLDRGCKVKAHDPVAMGRFREEQSGMQVVLCESAEQVVRDADALVLVTDWQEYRDLAWGQLARTMRKPLVLDGRNFLPRAQMEQCGFTYFAFGS